MNKSIDSYVLSLETINRISVRNRVEAALILLCNAWELLLKSRIIDLSNSAGSIYYPVRVRGEERRSLSLADCLNRIYPNQKDPTRRNIEILADLRHQAVHHVITEVPKDLLSLIQASVLNFHKLINEWFDLSLSDRVPVGMMTIVYDLSPDHFDLGMSALRKKMDKETALYLCRLQETIRNEREEQGNVPEFSLVFDYKLGLLKNPKGADVVLTQGEGGIPLGLVNVPRDSSRTHPYRRKELVQRVNELLAGSCIINNHDIQCVIKVYTVRKRSEFCYQGSVPGSPVQYSDAFAVWVAESFSSNPSFFTQIREQYRRGL